MKLMYLALLAMGAAWGITPVLVKIAVNAGYQPFGLVVWSLVIGIIMSGVGIALRRRAFPSILRPFGLFLGIALLGVVLPGYFTYMAAPHLPAGIMSIIIALVPMFAMPLALMLKLEKPSAIRVLGTVLGAMAVVLIVGPDASLPDSSKIGFVFIAMLAPLCYGGEGNFLIWHGVRGLDSIQILFGASIIGLILVLPLALATEQLVNPFIPWHGPEWAIFGFSTISWATYASYIWVLGRTGPVFASQVAYVVTGFGVLWSMVLLGERYSIWVWMAFVLMVLGVLLVQPRDSRA
ncbi:MAG: DMT family transporter [Paracoccaceae bacterium]